MAQGADHLARAKLVSPVRVDHAASDVPATCDGAGDRVNGQTSLHPVTDGVPHDPVAEHIFDRAEVEPSLTGLDSSNLRNT